jgi:hypothetical protein
MRMRASANWLLACLAAVAFVASARPGIAFHGKTVAPACQMLISAAVYDKKYPAREVGQCNADEHCLDTRRFFQQHLGKTIPQLKCTGVRESSSEAATKFFDNIFDTVCLAVGLSLASGQIEDEAGLRKTIALCNRAPNKDACRDTLDTLSSLEGARIDLRGLTCE